MAKENKKAFLARFPEQQCIHSRPVSRSRAPQVAASESRGSHLTRTKSLVLYCVLSRPSQESSFFSGLVGHLLHLLPLPELLLCPVELLWGKRCRRQNTHTHPKQIPTTNYQGFPSEGPGAPRPGCWIHLAAVSEGERPQSSQSMREVPTVERHCADKDMQSIAGNSEKCSEEQDLDKPSSSTET